MAKMKLNVSKDSGLKQNPSSEGEETTNKNFKNGKKLEQLKQGFLNVILGLMRNKRSYAIQGVSTSRSGEYSSTFQ